MAVIPTPTSGEIDAIDINRALDRADTTTMSMNGSAERGLAGVSSGEISFSDFYGKPNAPTILITNRTVTGGTQGAGIRLQSGGQFDEIVRELGTNFYTAISGQWMDPLGGAPGSDYDAQVDIYEANTAFDSSNISAVRYNLGITREWWFSSSVGSRYIDFTLTIYEAGTNTVVDSAFIMIQN